MILHILIAMVAGSIQRHQQRVITYLQEEKSGLKAQLGGHRLCLTDAERRRLAALAHPLGRQRLQETATLATPDTLLRWYKRLIAQKFDGSKKRRQLGRPRVSEEVEQLVVHMAEENPRWGYRRLQGALTNLGYHSEKITVRNILRRHHMEPAPQRRKAGMSWAQFLTLHWGVLYHAERNHQGLANQLMAPEPDLGSQSGQIRRRERLGGLLRYDYRHAA
jgi:putative transposase